MDKFVFVVVVLAFGAHVSAVEQFVFQAATYDIEETPGADNDDITTVIISRTGLAAETSVSKTITISTECPNHITATASSTDFEIDDDDTTTTTVTFPANDYLEEVPITIKDDNEEEFREFFCLTIVTDPGSEYTTTIYIPGNDYCVCVDTPPLTGGNEDDVSREGEVKYVGPWFVGETGYPDVISLDVQPDSDGGGDDINIFLTQYPDQNMVGDVGDYLGIFLDDENAATYTGAAPVGDDGDSVVVRDGIAAGDFVGYLNDANVDGANVVSSNGDRFTLEYTESSGAILLVDQSNINTQYDTTDTSATKVDVSHVFVSSGNNRYASWTVCGMLPRKLPTVGADASGHLGGRSPKKAIDGFRGPDFTVGGCFTSSLVVDPWLQIDLGREYDVKLVLIYPMDDPATQGLQIEASSLDNADVYVGSCPSTSIASITSNNQCDIGIGTFTTQLTVIEVKCQTTSYGRYVYIHQDTTSNAQFSLCEVEVYGDDIPYGESNEATIQFSSATFQTADDESATTVSITAKRTGSSALTCTTADFYTDTITIPGGNSDDFTAVLSTTPQTLSWVATDDTTAENLKTVSVTIANDANCEPTETFNVYLTNVNGGVLGFQSWSTVSIIDNDSVTYALTDSTLKVNEGSSVNIGVSRTGTGTMQAGSAGLIFTDGTALSGDYASAAATVDFTSSSSSPQYHELSTVEDQEYEGDETLTVTLDQDNLEPSTCSSAGTQKVITVTIEEDDSQFAWNVATDSITIPEGTATTTLAISRKGLGQPKTVNIDVDLNDADAADFTLSASSVTFSSTVDAGSTTVNVVDDSVYENDESFTLTLKDPLYTIGHKNLGDPYRVIVTIQNNDAVYTWGQAIYYAKESDGSVRVCLERYGYTSTTKAIQITSASGTARSGVDFTPLSQITFSGTSEACANVAITNDNTVDSSTTVFTLTIASGQQDVALGTRSTTTVEITDDDYSVTWESAFYSFEETTAVHYVIITKSGTGSPIITITSQQETARQGSDYETVTTTVTLCDSTASIPVTIYNDDEDEPSETFTITLSGTGISSSTTRVTITDDDPAPTEPPPEGLSNGAIAGIVVAGVVGTIIVVVAVVLFYLAIGGTGASSATAAAAAGGSAALQGASLGDYQLGGLSNLGNGLYGNGLSSQGFGNALSNQAFGSGLSNQAFGSGLSNQGFGGFNQQSLGFS